MERVIKNYQVYIELKEIFKHIDPNIVNKIPTKILGKINEVENKEYEFKYDTTKQLKEQKILKQTKELLSALYIQYCCNPREAEELTKICKQNDIKKYKEYEIDFNARKTKIMQNSKSTQTEENKRNTNLTLISKQTFFTKLLNKIKRIVLKY